MGNKIAFSLVPDFNKYILEDESQASGTKPNSQIVKDNFDKVILAKRFMDNIRANKSIKLSDKTTSNFLELFRKVIESFEQNNDTDNVANDSQKQSA